MRLQKDRHDRHHRYGLNLMRQAAIAKSGWSCRIQFHPFLSKQGWSTLLFPGAGWNACAGQGRQPLPSEVLRIDTSYWVLPADKNQFFDEKVEAGNFRTVEMMKGR